MRMASSISWTVDFIADAILEISPLPNRFSATVYHRPSPLPMAPTPDRGHVAAQSRHHCAGASVSLDQHGQQQAVYHQCPFSGMRGGNFFLTPSAKDKREVPHPEPNSVRKEISSGISRPSLACA